MGSQTALVLAAGDVLPQLLHFFAMLGGRARLRHFRGAVLAFGRVPQQQQALLLLPQHLLLLLGLVFLLFFRHGLLAVR